MDAGERRQLTVVFCDLVGSTELAARMDPEDWGDVVAHYHRCASDVIIGLGGHVAQYLGDGVLAYFGWPRAREDAPERAVRAGLELVTTVPTLRPGADGLHVRVGIHTGSVVVGAVGAGNEMLALGGAPNVAARVQGLAAPDTVLLTDATLELVRGAFRVEAAGTHALKGLQDPVTVHRAVASSGERSRRFTTPGARLTPFVGRGHELAILRERWAEACAGSGRVVLLQGEAGIGKSRLLGRLRQELACGPDEWIECTTSAYHENTPFFAVSDLLRGLVARDATDGGARSDVLRAALARGGLAVDDALPLVAPLAAIDVPDGRSAPASPEERHGRLLATLVAWVEGLARATPVVLLVEDLHWSDPSTLEMLEALADRGAAVPLLLVLTARPEFRLPWKPGAHHTTIALGRLPPDEARTLVERTAEGLARELVDVVVERTDGIPLFVEELTRLVAERVDALDPQAIPSTLSDSLMARLDGLGPARELVQVGAVVGRQFTYRHLRAVLPLAEDELAARLDRLGESDLVQVQGERPDAVYRFKHALVESTAYGSLLRGRRRDLHRAIAAALGAEPDTPPEVLARHHDGAGDLEQAVAAWKEAGERTAARGALGEAAGHYEAALGALGKLGDVPAHRARELPLRVALGQALFARKGYGSSEVADAFTRARILAAESSNPIETLPVLIGLYIWTLTRGDTATMRALVDDVTAAAESIGHRAALVWAHWAQGQACYVLGELATAERALARAIDAYHEDDHRGRPTDPGMASLVYAALTACRLGHADTARAHVAAATDLAHRLNKTYSVAFATYTCAVHTLLHDVDAVALLAPRAEALARENRFPIFELTGAMFQGWADAVGHGSAASIPRMRDALARYAGIGQRHMLGFYTGMLAEAEAATGEVDRALTTVCGALADACEPIDRSALRCIEGDVLARAGADSDAPAARYADALDVARAIGARLDELRAATRLASGLARRAKPNEARALLAPIAAGFVEGADTPDVRAARLLLAELA